MIRPRMMLVCLGLLVAGPAAAQIIGRPAEISAQAGWVHYDLRGHRQDGPGFSGSLGWRVNPWLVVEGTALFGPADADTLPNQKDNFTSAHADFRMDIRAAEGRIVPFATVGAGYAQSHTGGHPPDQLQRGSGTLGLGMLFGLGNGERTYARLDVRSIWFKERDSFDFSDHFAVTFGLHYVLGGKSHDTDLDGVRDGLDRCPNTPIGAHVDANGCPKDSDGDGVLDGIDQCPNTPKGCTVDAKGCPSDSDGDGVCDGLDVCANTPAGLLVDGRGCPVEVSEKETELLDTGMIRLQNINFETGKATLKPESFPVLADVAKILQQYPTLRIEIGGHTDDRGTNEHNETLSSGRATAVLDYMKQNFPQISSSQFTAKGYGEDRPIAPNSTELGRAKNRRVGFRVLNTDALRIEREKRHFLRKDEGTIRAPMPAPADTTRRGAPADTTRR